MRNKNFLSVLLSFFLIVSLSLGNVSIALADDASPGETPAAEPTEDPVDPPVMETATPEPSQEPVVEESQQPTEAVETAIPTSDEGLLAQLPAETELVVLDQNGETLPLVTQDALDVILDTDPMWCPANTPPGGTNCSTNFADIKTLLKDMQKFTGNYDEDGIIYFTASAGAFDLTANGHLGSDGFDALNEFDLILQGGWNGQNGVSADFSGQTNFGANAMTIGTADNPWVGSITLRNMVFSAVNSNNAVTIYTTTGNITLNNVDVAQQSGDHYTAYLESDSGNITVENGSSFDGNNSVNRQSRGFSAATGGAITITGNSTTPITFTDSRGTSTNYNGATLSAPVVTLNYVTANNNDLNGIQITNANVVTLNNVIASGNGTDDPALPDSQDAGSGVLVNGTGSTLVNLTGGAFTNNERYGVEVTNGAINIISSPTCTGNDLGCLIDSNPPTLNLPGNMTVEAASAAGATVTYSASATDNLDGNVAISCSPISGSVFPLGTTTVTCSANDSHNQTATGTFTVTVQDTTPPTLNLPGDLTAEATSAAGAAVTYSVSATDIVDGTVAVDCWPASGSVFPLGTTTVTCAASDSHNQTAIGTFIVTVDDTTPPTLNLPGNMIVEATSAAGAAATYSASATDIVDPNPVVSCLPASGSVFPLGTTTVTCSAMDSHSQTGTGTFTVTVRDTTPPILNLPNDITVEATSPAGATVTYSASATDIVDSNPAVNCSPASGSVFPLGTTTVTCAATDAYDQTSTGTFTVTVRDTTIPTLNLPSDMTVEATSAAGAAVTYSASATDNLDGSVAINCSPVSGSMFPLGITTVSCAASDSHNQTAYGSFSVAVVDTTKPIIQPHENIVVVNNSILGDNVSYVSPATYDNVDGAGVATCTPASGSFFQKGTTVVTCTTTDSHGNSALPITFLVRVNYVSKTTSTPSTSSHGNFVIPVTAGQLIDLDCNTVVSAFGIVVRFHNLCGYQAIITNADASTLPGQLDDGMSFVSGLNITVLLNGEVVNKLPVGAGVEVNFPISRNQDKFTALLWDGTNGSWTDVSQTITEPDISKTLQMDAELEFYYIQPTASTNGFYRILTTEFAGTIVIVSK